jgi:acyl transferase domain-containing protein/NAD(P)H-dependent flavin oxidoreductase YrpB (nitropropane dioxygenase family)
VSTTSSDRDLVIGIAPFHEPNADLVVAIERAGYLGVLDLGPDGDAARAALERVRRRVGRFGVRIAGGCPLSPADLPPEVDTIVVDPVLAPGAWGGGAGGAGGAWRDGGRRVLAEVACPQEAAGALRLGADGLVARGLEAGGRVGELSTFVLLQRLLGEFGVPVWAAGGIGPHTAAAAVAGGARGVVLDAQLALVAESQLPGEVAAAVAAMDGSETTVVGGFRVYTRPGLPAIEPSPDRFGARDLRRQLLPAGQDGAFAARLAARFKTAGGVVQAVGEAIMSQIRLAAEVEPLKGSIPVQGPMTRVSDRAELAVAVAGAGGLPFLALALMPGEEAGELLAATAGLLGGLPWGAGILGFAPPGLRAAQFAAILAVRPPYALIAGGRPSQAAALQEAGIETFLHVPSPGLLDQFLAAGARRFVFEGAECGGHIGPRGSFALWEAQVARLLEEPGLDGVHAWFAGGIHDERSAAMVAAMAAPLAERGAAVNVLMGTAYLFTGEVVQAGAVLPLYQRTARECGGTALLETSPGHVIRCADTPYVATFAEAKQRLAQAGAGQQEAWTELEQLSLGRLRIAAKGLRRDGETLVAVGEKEARADGMFMVGQVAALRSEVTSVAALHEQVTSGATSFLAARAEALRVPEPGAKARPLDVAIVGMACVYPGADGLAAYWANVVAGADAVGDVPAERWQAHVYPDVPSARGGFIPRVPFDALGYGIPPSALASIEPVQLLALEVAARALADAGYAGRPFDRMRASVIFGAEAGSDLSAAYGLRAALPAYTGKVPDELDEFLPRLTEDSFPGVLGNVIAGRIANRLDLGGVNYSVDAACASSLAALDLACKELVAGTSDMVLCGGADTHNGVIDYQVFASVRALSAHGRCATFDAAADGIALGEGVACVVLKRLADAERDGDRIYAVVKGVGGASDGRSLGLTAPRPEGQRRALERAYAMAGVSPAQVGLVEAHGTGTVAGDRAELATLTAVFTEAGAEPGGCTVGSVKSQVGHTKCAAGLAGLIKAACAVHTGARPGTIHLSEPNPYWDRVTSPFAFTAGPARPWPAAPAERHAGISAFGFGGTNFHAVISGYEGADEPAHGLRDWPAELITLRGDPAGAAEALRELIAANDAAGRPWRLAELAATMAARPGEVRAAFVAGDLDGLAARLPGPPSGASAPGPGTIAFLFPGQGSQRPGMAGDLFTAFPRLQRLLRLVGPRYAEAMFPPAAFTSQDRERAVAALTDTRVAQPALGIAGLAISELLALVGVRPGMAAGHSYGELLALCAAGVYGEADLLQLSEARAAAIIEAIGDDPGAMAAVNGPAERVEALLAGSGVVIANYNAPAQAAISGATEAVDAAIGVLAARGLSARRIPVACAFHSPLVAPAAQALGAALAGRDIAAPRFPVFANSTAAPYPGDPGEVRRILAGQVAEPVRFAQQVEAMYQAGARTFIEAGPGRVLTGLVRQVLGDRPHTAVACDVPGENGLRQFLAALAELATAGVPVDPWPLFAGRAEPVTGTPSRSQWTVDGHLVRSADGMPVPGGLQPATLAPRLSLGADSHGVQSASARPDSVVTEFLRTTRELVAAQREVVLGYLGAAPLPAAVPLATAPVQIASEPERTGLPPYRQAPAAPAAGAVPARDAMTTAQAAPLGRAEIAEAVAAIISARTGYPRDMLGIGLDLEADLSIDSIKRTEIIAVLAGQFGLTTSGAAADESVIEELTQVKTISGITDWLAWHIGGGVADGGTADGGHQPADPAGSAVRMESAVQAVSAASAGTVADHLLTGTPRRLLVEEVDLAPAAGDLAPGDRFLIVDDGRGIALELSGLLEQHGAQTVTTGTPTRDELSRTAALVHLGALRPGAGDVLPGAFEAVRAALAGGARTLLVATATGGTFGRECEGDPCDLGVRGMIRTIAAEYQDVVARAVDVQPKDSPRAIAAQLLAELADRSGPPVTGYREGQRVGLRVREDILLPSAGRLDLDGDSVVLLTGGARGITASVALALARQYGCHVELIGRTPPPGPADPEVEAAADPAALRRLLVERGLRDPRAVEAETGRVLRDREIRVTLVGLRAVAASVRYHAADVCDASAVGAVLGDVYGRHGRLDGVIHGAGVVEDRLIRDKSPESFARVYQTKVDGARALAAGLRDDVRFFALFGSVSGVFGNRGQADYSAANDALDSLAHAWSARLPGRVVTVDWGPWAGGGMISPELEREYARRGVPLIDPRAGVSCLLAELAAGFGPAQVVYLCGEVPSD